MRGIVLTETYNPADTDERTENLSNDILLNDTSEVFCNYTDFNNTPHPTDTDLIDDGTVLPDYKVSDDDSSVNNGDGVHG